MLIHRIAAMFGVVKSSSESMAKSQTEPDTVVTEDVEVAEDKRLPMQKSRIAFAKSMIGRTAKKVTVTRAGKTFQQTVWVKQGEDIAGKKSEGKHTAQSGHDKNVEHYTKLFPSGMKNVAGFIQDAMEVQFRRKEGKGKVAFEKDANEHLSALMQVANEVHGLDGAMLFNAAEQSSKRVKPTAQTEKNTEKTDTGVSSGSLSLKDFEFSSDEVYDESRQKKKKQYITYNSPDGTTHEGEIKMKRGIPQVEWDDETPDNWEDIDAFVNKNMAHISKTK